MNHRISGTSLAALGAALLAAASTLLTITPCATAPKTAGGFLDRGIAFALWGNYDKAAADFTQAIRLDPQSCLGV